MMHRGSCFATTRAVVEDPVRQQDGEFVAAGAGGHVADALVRSKAASNQLEERVAMLGAHRRSVHRLQPIAVQTIADTGMSSVAARRSSSSKSRRSRGG